MIGGFGKDSPGLQRSPVKNDSLLGLSPSLHHDQKTRCKDIEFERYNFPIPKDVKVHLEWLYGQACQFQKEISI
ncbi:hypothetical protein Glove_74g224 [Diversispora epigaea]|uniref:Uncharacterized protein n=1 Tax=Diversispora epigaea TaxID=1348612 RepID=A0A397JII3_9GLOM|nr:hypothetical protein Glove_74g224 [Diversispora epigaea]